MRNLLDILVVRTGLNHEISADGSNQAIARDTDNALAGDRRCRQQTAWQLMVAAKAL